MTVTKIGTSPQRLEFEDSGRTTIVEFDKRHIFVKQKKWHIELGTSTRLLHHLSPAISSDYSNDPDAAKRIRTSWLFLFGAIVVYFSDYNASIPLLAPALLLLWLLVFLPNGRRALPKRWLVVNDEYGILVVRIRAAAKEHEASASLEQAFVESLRKAIDDAKQKEYGLVSQA